MNEYDISSIFKEMEEYLIDSMMRNMKKHTDWETAEGFKWDMWQARQLEALNDYRKNNLGYVDKQTNIVKLRLKELLKKSKAHGNLKEEIKILKAIKKGAKLRKPKAQKDASFFRVNDRKLNAMYEAISNDLTKASQAMLRKAEDEYRKIIYKPAMFANTGTMTYDQAVDMATKDFLSKGINCIKYKDDRVVNIVSYAEMAIRTANKRAYLQGEGEKRKEWGISTVLVSQYGACSPICLPLQGQVYIDDVWSGGMSDGSYPLLSEAIDSGLYHPNCKHTHTTYFEGITEIPKQIDVAKTSENAQTVATQRYNERQIRKYKRLENNSLDATNKARYASKVKEWQAKQRKLVDDTDGMKRNYKREALRVEPSLKNKAISSEKRYQKPNIVVRNVIDKPIITNDQDIIANANSDFDKFMKNKGLSEIEAIDYIRENRKRSSLLSMMNENDGFNGLPTIITNDKAFDDYPSDLLLRGLHGTNKDIADYAEQFQNGDFYTAKGVYGNGLYTAKHSEKNLEKVISNYADGKESNVFKMKLITDAKIINTEELDERFKGLKQIFNSDKTYSDIDNKNFAIRALLNDKGRYAEYLGYDAIHVQNQDYVVILNRSKVIFKG